MRICLLTLLAGCVGAGSGCGDDGSTPFDAGSADSGSDGGLFAVAAPDDPAPPSITACPPGWREMTSPSGTLSCEPWAGEGPVDCGDAQAHFPGEPACADVGSACPTGEWSDALPTDRPVVHVLAGATGGDGTMGLPWATVAEAIAAASGATTIALGKGMYDESVVLGASTILHGACAAETVVTSSVRTDEEPVIEAGGSGVEVRDLQIADASRPGIGVGRGGDVHLEGVVVSGVEAAAVYAVDGGGLTARELLMRGTRAVGGEQGEGLIVANGASAELSRAAIEGNRELAVFVVDAAASLVLEDAVVRDTASRALDGVMGNGLHAQGAVMLTARRTTIENNGGIGAFATRGARLLLEDAIVRDTQPWPRDGQFGRGVSLQEGGVGELVRVVVDTNTETGVYAGVDRARARLRDSVVRGTQSRFADGWWGHGLHIERAGIAELERCVVEENHGIGVFAWHAETLVTLTDVVAQATRGRAIDDLFGYGMAVQEGATAEVTRAAFDRNLSSAILANAASVTLSHVRMHGDPDGGFAGRGLNAQDGAEVQLSHASFEDLREIALLAVSPGTTVQAEQVTIRGTLPRACADTTCADAPGGHGIGSYVSATTDIRGFVSVGANICGAHVAREGSLDLHDGAIARNEIGACIQVDGYDAERLSDNVSYPENGVNLQATDLPIPEATPGFS